MICDRYVAADEALLLNSSHPNLLIIGASTRAAAFSALRAGLRPLCLDMYADLDLQTHAPVHRIDNYPYGLIAALKALPRMPLIYVGGLENQPEILQVADEFHDLLGNTVKQVESARDVQLLSEVTRLAQVSFPEWRLADNPPPLDGTWILRPQYGSGGRGITTWDEQARDSDILRESHLFQKRIFGKSYSGLYVASADVGDIRFVGITEQLIGLPECHASEFQWCGNIGPTTLSVPIEHKLRRIGNVLKWKAGLKGVFGVDFILTEDEQIFVTEVNPRYPASFELLEFATGHALLQTHMACFGEYDTTTSWNSQTTGPLWGKAVYYAPEDFQLSESLTAQGCHFSEFPAIADIPEPGSQFRTGEPVCTLFAQGSNVHQCREKLTQHLEAFHRLMMPSS